MAAHCVGKTQLLALPVLDFFKAILKITWLESIRIQTQVCLTPESLLLTLSHPEQA